MARTRTSFKKGRAKTGGRKRGTPNVIPRQVRELIRGALDAAGGEEYLVAQAKKRPAVFLALVGKIIEKELQVDVRAREVVEVRNFTGLDQETLDRLDRAGWCDKPLARPTDAEL